jgi:Alginate lyase
MIETSEKVLRRSMTAEPSQNRNDPEQAMTFAEVSDQKTSPVTIGNLCMKTWIATVFFGFCATVFAGEAKPPALCNFDGTVLLARKKQVAAGDAAIAGDVRRIRAEADKVMLGPIVTITGDKKHVAPGGDPHDYVSIGTYYWPNPATPNGLPWIARDGEKNPLKDEYDEARLVKMCGAVRTLALAGYLTGDEKYAARAAQQLRAWFLDPATRMNPNLEHAQMQFGKNEGTGTGIIDSRGLADVTDAAVLLRGSGAWTPGDDAKLQKWFHDYFVWLTTSRNGVRESNASNNHSVWYDVQAVAIAQYVGDEKSARDILEAAKTKRIAKQIEPDGSMPRELARTLSVTYSLFNLEAFFKLARLGRNAGVDLWNFKTADGRGIRAALDYVIPYATGKKEWTQKQIKNANYSGIVPLLRQAGRIWHEPAYEKAIDEVIGAKGVEKIGFLLPAEK